MEGPAVPWMHERLKAVVDMGTLRTHVVTSYAAAVHELAARSTRLARLANLEILGAAPVLDEMALPLDAFDEGPLREGCDAYMLMQQLADADETGVLAREVAPEQYADPSGYWFYHRNVCRVEIVRESKLERIYFPRPLLANYLTKVSQDTFVTQVDRSSPAAKIDALVEATDDFMKEMNHQASLSRWPFVSFATRQLENLKLVSFGLACAINFLILLSYGVDQPTDGSMGTSGLLTHIVNGNSTLGGPETEIAIRTLGFLQTIASTTIVVVFFLNFAPLIIKRRWDERVRERRLARMAATETATGRSLVQHLEGLTIFQRQYQMLLEYGPDHKDLNLPIVWLPYQLYCVW